LNFIDGAKVPNYKQLTMTRAGLLTLLKKRIPGLGPVRARTAGTFSGQFTGSALSHPNIYKGFRLFQTTRGRSKTSERQDESHVCLNLYPKATPGSPKPF
jgi:hypothetical protein